MLNYIISSFLKVCVYGTILFVFSEFFINVHDINDLQYGYDFMSSEKTLYCTDGLPSPTSLNLIINGENFDGFY